MTSNSAYGGARFYTAVYKKSAGYNSGALIFQGFILPPVEFEENSDAGGNGIKIGDVVRFIGGNVYGSSSTAVSANKIEKAGKVKITNIAVGMKHPYHAVSQDGGGVFEWIDSDSVGKTVDEIAREVVLGKWGNGREKETFGGCWV